MTHLIVQFFELSVTYSSLDSILNMQFWNKSMVYVMSETKCNILQRLKICDLWHYSAWVLIHYYF